ncbi:MAG: squalene/phytoene synthase family protein [Dehalococcoidia bacterium]|nr:squalene/phytoene synthase family protein [Dehalococcoidia bacterium]
MNKKDSLKESIKICYKIINKNYENFPIFLFFLSKTSMDDYAAIYAFSRGVDYIGDNSSGNRLEELKIWEKELKKAFEKKASLPVFIALQNTITNHNLEFNTFNRLIQANIMDQKIKKYNTFNDLLNYCSYSANPVGEIVLNIMGYQNKSLILLSNEICSGLQITNFLQDLVEDKKIDRCYVPQDLIKKHGLTDEIFNVSHEFDHKSTDGLKKILKEMIKLNRELYLKGKELTQLLSLKDKIIIQIFLSSGEKVLNKIEKNGLNILSKKPKTNKLEKLLIITLSVIKSIFLKK